MMVTLSGLRQSYRSLYDIRIVAGIHNKLLTSLARSTTTNRQMWTASPNKGTLTVSTADVMPKVFIVLYVRSH